MTQGGGGHLLAVVAVEFLCFFERVANVRHFFENALVLFFFVTRCLRSKMIFCSRQLASSGGDWWFVVVVVVLVCVCVTVAEICDED